ncbi:MAG: T9SS type A sorting domain-containing protein, partial [Bacteroidota bacterium]
NQWLIEDSTVYYVSGRAGGLWKLVFTGFGGASTGIFEFYKEQISSTGVEENNSPVLLSAYPNPASDMIQLTLFVETPTSDDVVLITDMRGAMVLQSSLEKQSGLFTQTIAVDNLSTGIYNIRVIAGGKASDQRISIVK